MIKKKHTTLYFKLNDYVVGESVFTHAMFRYGRITVIRTKYSDNELLVGINNEKSFLEIVISNPSFIFRCVR